MMQLLLKKAGNLTCGSLSVRGSGKSILRKWEDSALLMRKRFHSVLNFDHKTRSLAVRQKQNRSGVFFRSAYSLESIFVPQRFKVVLDNTSGVLVTFDDRKKHA